MFLSIPGVLTEAEVGTVVRELGEGSYEDGRASAGPLARDVKNNLQIKRDAAAAQKCAPMLLGALRRHQLFVSATFPVKIHGPIFNRYDPGMAYGSHVDNAMMGESASIRSDVSATLFLSSPDTYEGGDLVIQEHQGERRIKLPAGAIVLYPSTSLHRVEPVKRGMRLAAVFWIQSLVREESKRDILFDLDRTAATLHGKVEPSVLVNLGGIYHNLLRMWAEA